MVLELINQHGLKALAVAEGDESKQKAIYLRLRAKQLSETTVADDEDPPVDESQENGVADKRANGLEDKQAEAERLRQKARKRNNITNFWFI